MSHYEVMPPNEQAKVVAAAKRTLKPGSVLDGEGGFTTYGLIERADIVQKENLVPIGLTQGAKVLRNISEDDMITFDNVKVPDSFAYQLLQQASIS